jgi:uncharacterized repeat protein (TIGR03803 family)
MKTRTYLIKVKASIALGCALLVAFAAAPLHAQTYQDLYDFNCSTGGCNPFDSGQLTQGPDGNLYGTTTGQNSSGNGTIFMVTPSGTYTDLVQFNGTNGSSPLGGLTLASDGKFYGTATSGGSGYGTVFRFTPPSTITVLHTFNYTDGSSPEAPPVEAKDGNLYGATYPGTTYRITLPAGTFKQLPNNTPGFTSDPLFLASDGNLYGTTFNGGPGGSGPGTVFRMTTAGAIKTIHNFSGSDGSFPSSPLTQASDGNLYGTTHDGGANGSGVIFKLTLSGTFTVLHSFDVYTGTFRTNNDGGGPVAGLLAASDGYLYGANSLGGACADGTLFQATKGGFFTKVFDFPGTCDNFESGPDPTSTLMQHTNGSFYGVAWAGFTSNGTGNFYSLTPTNRFITLIVEGPVWLKPGGPVEIFGDRLTQVTKLTFGGVPAQFHAGSDTYLVATVPTSAADGLIIATLATGQQVKSQRVVHILPKITNLNPSSGPVGTQVGIAGGGFKGTRKVTFGGVATTNFTVVNPTLIQATVPTGAKTGKVSVTTPNGIATSTQTFTVN